jgi:hypothetical protein
MLLMLENKPVDEDEGGEDSNAECEEDDVGRSSSEAEGDE